MNLATQKILNFKVHSRSNTICRTHTFYHDFWHWHTNTLPSPPPSPPPSTITIKHRLDVSRKNRTELNKLPTIVMKERSQIHVGESWGTDRQKEPKWKKDGDKWSEKKKLVCLFVYERMFCFHFFFKQNAMFFVHFEWLFCLHTALWTVCLETFALSKLKNF